MQDQKCLSSTEKKTAIIFSGFGILHSSFLSLLNTQTPQTLVLNPVSKVPGLVPARRQLDTSYLLFDLTFSSQGSGDSQCLQHHRIRALIHVCPESGGVGGWGGYHNRAHLSFIYIWSKEDLDRDTCHHSKRTAPVCSTPSSP